ncbi:MAG: universal stress protein [Thermodesulfobacteriota bacterium]
MEEFKKILFPTDLSEISAKMVPYVKMMTKKFDAELHVVFVCRMLENLKSIYVPHPSLLNMEKEVLKGAQIKMKEFVKENFSPEILPETGVFLGDTVDTVMEYNEQKNIDLIIVGTHGRKGLERFIFGSVAKEIFQRSAVPVLIINPYNTKVKS